MDLRQATKTLLNAPDVAEQLRLADNYIQNYNRLPTKFVLPYEHRELRPVIEAFASDLKAFVAYIKALRDGCEGERYIELHELYRTISLRSLQQGRRQRISKAVELLGEPAARVLGRPLTADDRLRLGRLVEQRWGVMRLDFMRDAREEVNAKKLSAEQRDEVLADFWNSIEQGLAHGVVTLDADVELLVKEYLK